MQHAALPSTNISDTILFTTVSFANTVFLVEDAEDRDCSAIEGRDIVAFITTSIVLKPKSQQQRFWQASRPFPAPTSLPERVPLLQPHPS
jgi:hypothetical protein